MSNTRDYNVFKKIIDMVFLILSKLVDVIKDQTEDVVARWGVIK